jgi:hypothetical protein
LRPSPLAVTVLPSLRSRRVACARLPSETAVTVVCLPFPFLFLSSSLLVVTELVLVTVCGIPNSAEFAFPTTQSVELLRRERRRAVRPSWGEYRDQRHRSKRTNVVRTRGELGKADADVSKDAPFDARRPPDRVQNTRGRPTYNKSLFYCRFDVIPAWVVRSMPLAGAARLAQG